ncbi:MAG: hypothetical protein ACO4AJ_12105 [Prochlorothrix sp.]|nr:hypothetical protein [Prochlorothrix sp.]
MRQGDDRSVYRDAVQDVSGKQDPGGHFLGLHLWTLSRSIGNARDNSSQPQPL